MLSRFGALTRACRASSRQHVWRNPEAQIAFLDNAWTSEDQANGCCSSHQACLFHASPAPNANPDNKPPPPGKHKNDPTNVKYDTPTKDPDDTSDYAPGYYDDKGKGGHKRVASQEESKQVDDNIIGGMPENWDPEEKDDPTQPRSKDPHAPDVPSMEPAITPETSRSGSAADPQNPNKDPPVGRGTEVSEGSMPNAQSQLAGMPAAMSPPEEEGAAVPPEHKATPYNEESPLGQPDVPEDMPTTASDILKEGGVRPGAPPRAGLEDLPQNK